MDIVDFVLYTVYPTAAFFLVGFIAKKTGLRQVFTYLIQAVICFVFAAVYYVTIPLGGADGLAIILALFGGLLLFMARKQKIQQEQQNTGEI